MKKNPSELKIVLVGAGGMSFGPVMVHDAIHSPKIAGSELVLHDIDEQKLDSAFAAAERLNTAAGEPVRMTRTTDAETAYKDADFLLLSVELERFWGWKLDYEIPVKYGSTQIMGENGGPGGMFHSLRSIKTVLGICDTAAAICPDAYVLNLTNPMSRVTLAINRATNFRNVGLCHEFSGGIARLMFMLLKPMKKINAKASGINHFTFFYQIDDADTGEDLYPRVRKHIENFPFLHPPLVSHICREYGLFATSEDSHIGEYFPGVKDIVGRHMNFRRFHQTDCAIRDQLTKWYGKGLFPPIPIHKLPRSFEQAFPIIEALATGERTYLDAANVPNRGFISNLPDDAIVEVPAWTGDTDLEPETVPPMQDDLAAMMQTQIEIQDLVVRSALEKDPDLAFQAIVMDPLSPPDETQCRRMFDEMMDTQKHLLPFA